ncbi:MAG TPA: hypothetical protein EYN51_09395 [Flavobacteriales bacterium]|nr:hypothetical protein [Flavobacteriales bacterium]HIN76234.1 hypothetical protein [Rhodospirillales bacterium]
MNIYIDKIAIDPKIVGRADGLDSDTVESYADDMEGGAVFPPIEVVSDGDIFWLVDGQHRLEAAKKINKEQVSGNVTEGDKRLAMLMSCSTNAEHGKPRTNEDKRQKVLMLLEDDEWNGWSSRDIASQCKVSHTFVDKLRNLTGNVASDKAERTYVTKHGTTAIMNTTNIGGNDNGKLVQTEIEPIILAEAAYEEKVKLLKELWCQYASLLTKANVISKRMAVNYDEYDIRVTLEDDSFLRESIGKAMDVNIDFIEGVKHGFQSKSA